MTSQVYLRFHRLWIQSVGIQGMLGLCMMVDGFVMLELYMEDFNSLSLRV